MYIYIYIYIHHVLCYITVGKDGKGNMLELLKREVAVWKKVKHKHCLQLFEVIDDPSKSICIFVKRVNRVDTFNVMMPISFALFNVYIFVFIFKKIWEKELCRLLTKAFRVLRLSMYFSP